MIEMQALQDCAIHGQSDINGSETENIKLFLDQLPYRICLVWHDYAFLKQWWL